MPRPRCRVRNLRSLMFLAAALSAPGCTSGPVYYLEPPEESVPGSLAQRDRLDRAAAARDKSASVEAPLLASIDQPSDTPLAQRVVIYNAGLRIVVADPPSAVRDVQRLAESSGGYVQQLENERIVIRTPANRFHETIAALEAMGQVSERRIDALDVTDEYIDLEARLRNAVRVRERLEGLLAKSEDVKAAVEVERELRRVGEEIETLTAKLEALKNRVALCTISVDFQRAAAAANRFRGAARLPFSWLRQLDPVRLLQE